VIFDLDGLLLNTEPIYWKAAEDIVSRFGKHYSDDLVLQVLGKQESIGAKIILDSLQIPLSVEEFLGERDVKVEELFPTAEEMPGGKILSELIFKRGFPVGLATSSNATAVRLKLSNHQDWFCGCFGYQEAHFSRLQRLMKKRSRIYDLIADHSLSSDIDKSDNDKDEDEKEERKERPQRRIVCGDEVRNAKPSPDIYLEAARRIKIDPEYCLVFEDAPGGVTAAKAAGMIAVAVPPTIFKVDPSLYSHADLVISSLKNFDLDAFLAGGGAP